MKKEDVQNAGSFFVWHNISDEAYARPLLHCHNEYEIYYLIKGAIRFKVEGFEYQLSPESLLLIPPHSFHERRINSTGICHRVSFHFLPEFLDEPERALFLETFHSDKRYYPDLSFFKIDFFVQSILECMNMEKSLQPIALKSRLVSLLSQIYRIHSKNALQPVPGDERIQAVLQYLNDNLLESLSLDELSRKFHISKNHLNVIFRHETGTTINQYIRIKRLSKAQNEIMAGCPTEEAAFKAGFNDYSNFYRAYKAFFGTLPSAPVIGT